MENASRLALDENGDIDVQQQPFSRLDIAQAAKLLQHFDGDWLAAMDAIRVAADLKYLLSAG